MRVNVTPTRGEKNIKMFESSGRGTGNTRIFAYGDPMLNRCPL